MLWSGASESMERIPGHVLEIFNHTLPLITHHHLKISNADLKDEPTKEKDCKRKVWPAFRKEALKL